MLEFGFYNMDCMDGMREFPDKYFDLAIVDPPYGIGCMSMNYTKSGAIRTRGYSAAKRRDYRKQSQWDVKPDKKYFLELLRVSEKQIIWGGNYFADIFLYLKISCITKFIYSRFDNLPGRLHNKN